MTCKPSTAPEKPTRTPRKKVNMPQEVEHILDALSLFYSDDLQ